MEIVILNYDYPDFVEWLYRDSRPGLADESYDRQLAARQETLFSGISLANKLRELGHRVHILHYSNEYIQKTWAEENGVNVGPEGFERFLSWLDGLSDRNLWTGFGSLHFRYSEPPWYYKTLKAQLREISPDVIVNRGLAIEKPFLEQLSDAYDTLVGEVSLPTQLDEDLGMYDLIVTPYLKFYRKLQRQNVPAAHVRFGFDDDLYQETEPGEQATVSFVGSLTSRHTDRIELLEYLCDHVDIDVWAPSVSSLPDDSPIREHYRGVAWGRDMYNVLRQSQMTLNRHIDIATGLVGNHRLYEATGLGTALVTDEKDGLEELYEPGEEVITYDSPEECLERIQHYLEHDEERATIAQRGRQRAYDDHLYIDRAKAYESAIREHR